MAKDKNIDETEHFEIDHLIPPPPDDVFSDTEEEPEAPTSVPENPGPNKGNKEREKKDEEEKDQSDAMKVMRAFTSDDDEEHINWSLSSILGGEIFSARWFRHQAGIFVLIIFLTILYISNRYSSQQEMIKIDNLKKELLDMRYDAMSRSSQLMQRSRESKIIEYLKNTSDSAIGIANEPPFIIKASAE
jgi:hypothetical protein